MGPDRQEGTDTATGKLQSIKEIADIFGLTEQRIGQLIKEGTITPTQTDPYRFDLLPTVKTYIAHLQEKARGRETTPEEARELAIEKIEAETRYKKAKAERAELELQEIRGQMHRSEDVAAMTDDLIWTVKGLMLALPGKLAVDAAEAATPAEESEIIRREVCTALEDLTRHEYDPEKYRERVREREKMELAQEEAANDGKRPKAKQNTKASPRTRKTAGKSNSKRVGG